MTHDKALIELTLIHLCKELQRLGLWSEYSPSAEQLSSSMPFCVDTLRFEQWLQFIFVPKLSALIQSKAPLPTKVSISPMAEEAYKNKGQAFEYLISLLIKLDELLSAVTDD